MASLPQKARELLQTKTIAHLAVLTDQGPHVSPVWVDVEGDQVLVNSAEGRVKTEAIKADPRVGLSATHPDNPYQKVIIQGRVTDVRHEGARDHINKMASKYLGKDVYPGPADETRIILVIEPERVVS